LLFRKETTRLGRTPLLLEEPGWQSHTVARQPLLGRRETRMLVNGMRTRARAFEAERTSCPSLCAVLFLTVVVSVALKTEKSTIFDPFFPMNYLRFSRHR